MSRQSRVSRAARLFARLEAALVSTWRCGRERDRTSVLYPPVSRACVMCVVYLCMCVCVRAAWFGQSGVVMCVVYVCMCICVHVRVCAGVVCQSGVRNVRRGRVYVCMCVCACARGRVAQSNASVAELSEVGRAAILKHTTGWLFCPRFHFSLFALFYPSLSFLSSLSLSLHFFVGACCNLVVCCVHFSQCLPCRLLHTVYCTLY
jgi:hypothetical protein